LTTRLSEHQEHRLPQNIHGNNGQWGWGYFFHEYFDENKITVENHALGGTSSRTFYTHLWKDVLKGVKKGDWVIIELGHNDNGPYDSGRARASIPGIGKDSLEVTIKETGVKETVYTYGEYMRRYIREVKAMDVMRNIGVTLGNVWSIFKSVLTIVIQLISSFIPESISMGTSIKDVSDKVVEITSSMRKWFEELANSKDKFDTIKKGVKQVSDAISNLFGGTKKFSAVSIFDGIGNVLKGIGKFFKPVIDGFKTFLSLLTPANVLAGGFAMVAWKMIGMIKNLGKNFDDLKEHFTGFESIKDLIFGKKDDDDSFKWMDGLKQGLDNLTSFTNLATLISIAVSIGILAKALDTLSGLETKDIVEGMSAIGVAMHALQVNMNKLNGLKINPRVATTLVAFAFALKLIAGAIKTLAGLKPMEVVQGQIQLMAVVKLVVIPILIEIIILSLVPRERIRTTQSQMIGAISGISLNAIEEPLAIHHLRIPMLSRRLYAYPTAVLKQMLGQLVIPFERQKPMAVGLGIDSCRKLIRTHWLQISGSRYPIIRRQGQVAVRDLMHILGHLSKGSLQRHLIAQLIFQGKTWVDIQEVLVTDMKKAHIEANIHTPVAVDIDFILCVYRPLMRHMTITTIHSDGINLG
jgi:lysophospholipase L1-like esterase